MPDYTEHYNLIQLEAGEALSQDSYKFTQADRALIDRLLYLGAEGHHHTGGAVNDETPEDAPTLELDSTSGLMGAGVRPYYLFTFISPDGIETAASPSAYIDTAPAITAPAAATYAIASTGGTLTPGGYYYALSAYTDDSSYETPATSAVYVNIPTGTSTNKVTLTLPTLPGGADGFNIYRRTPTGQAYLHVGSTTSTTTFVDSGSLTEDCDRFAPTTNTTLSTNSVTVGIPGATPEVPDDGWAWRIYRTFNSADWTASVLTTITDGSVIYVDTGTATTTGQPPSTAISVGNPSAIQLEDGAEIQGRAPMARISAFPVVETFSYPGPLSLVVGESAWVCPFPQATIIGVQASLGRSSTANAQSVVVDVNRGRAGVWASLFSGGAANQPRVLTGAQVGATVVPNSITELLVGDQITVDIDQTGGGTNTDNDLTVMLYLYVYGWTGTASHNWA